MPTNTEFADRDDAVLRAAAHRLADTIAPFRVLTREQLENLSGAGEWRSVSLQLVLRWAVEHGVLRRLSEDLYEIPRQRAPAKDRRSS